MKKRIILIGAIYYQNLGDAALCYVARDLLSSRYDVTLVDIYGRTEFPAPVEVDVDDCRRSFKRIVRRLKTRDALLRIGIIPYDRKKKLMFDRVERQLSEIIEREKPAAIVFAGGALFKGVFINSIVRIVELARRYRIPVLFNACGIDSEMRKAEWGKIGRVFHDETVRYISVRDGCELLSQKFPDVAFHDTYDPAICANRIFTSNPVRRGVGLGIMLSHNFDFDNQAAFWCRLIHRLNADKLEWRMFTNGAPADQSFARYLLRHNNEREDRLVPRPSTPDELFRVISGFESIVSMRLHSHILAYSSGTPSVAVSWDRKVNTFFDKLGKTEYCMDFTVSSEVILASLIKICGDKEYFNGRLEREKQVEANYTTMMNIID